MKHSHEDTMVCGFCHLPPEDSHDREIIDRFADFLREAPSPGSGYIQSAPARYRFRYLAWRIGWDPPWSS